MTPSYHVMSCPGAWPVRPLKRGPDLHANWRDGALVDAPASLPLRYLLDDDFEGEPKPMYPESAVPLMRDDVVALLQGCGVDNLQLFDAVVVDGASGRERHDYKAFNLVGLVAAADLPRSTLMPTSPQRLLDMDFEALVVDPARARGQLMFRLAENVSAIVVHERIRAAVEASGLRGFRFAGPGEWSG